MRCVSCGDLIHVAVVAVDGQPVGGCGMEGVLSKGGEIVPAVSYWKAVGSNDRRLETLKGSDVKQGSSAAANLRPLAKILMSRAVAA